MKKILSIVMVMLMVLMMVPMAVSASTQIDFTQEASFSVLCEKPGYTFTVYKVADFASNDASPYKTEYVSLIPEIDGEVLNGDPQAVRAILDGVETMPASVPVVGTFETNGVITSKSFDSLDWGIYYIKATNFPAGVKSVTNSVVTLPYFDGTDWIYNISDIVLAAKVVDEKVVTEKTITNSTKGNVNYTDVNLGDVVDFDITSTTAGSTSMKLNSYAVYDEMSAGLTLDTDSFVVTLLDGNDNPIRELTGSVGTVASGDEYTVDITSAAEGEATVFNIDLTPEFLQLDEFYNAEKISVTYSATLNKYAVVGKDGNPNTEVKVEYSNKNGVTDSTEGNTVYVYTYTIKAYKYDENGEPLEGAYFELYKTTEDANNMENAIATASSDETGLVVFYNENGEVVRLESGTYYAVETAAPDGYNTYGKVITVDLTAEYSDTFANGTYVVNCPEDGTAWFTLYNTKLFLPLTGGEGRTIIYIIGAFIALTGVVFVTAYSAKRKRRTTN